MPINSNQRQNSTFSQEKKPKTSNTGNRPTQRKVSRTKTAPNSKVR